MHNLLQRLLKKRGLDSITQLDEFEKQDFERWQGILSEGEITVQKIQEFCKKQIKIIEGQWRDLDNTKEKNDKLITQHIIYKTLLELIESQGIQKENLEKYLEELTK